MAEGSTAIQHIADHVGAIAAQSPARIAVVTNGQLVSYAQLHRSMHCVAVALARLGLRAGQLVVIGHADVFEHALILAGFDLLGVVAASYRAGEGAPCHALLAVADLVVTSEAVPEADCRRHVALGPEWFAAACAVGDAAPGLAASTLPIAWPPAHPQQPLHMVRSSGTTGQPKRMLVTRAMLDARCTQRRAAYGMDANSRLFVAMHLSVYNVVSGVVLSWRLGGMVVIETRLPLALALAASGATHVTLLPLQLAGYLAELPDDFARLPGLTVCVMGGRLPSQVRQAALARLAGRVVEHYGSREAGLICVLDDDRTGLLAPGVEVVILDADAAQPVAPGQVGRLAVRGASVAAGYVDEPALTARHFRDGWWITNDLAVLLGGGRLRLVGRTGEVLNIGGLKLACAEVEYAVRAAAGVADVAVLVAEDDTAAGVIVAVVLAPGTALASADALIRQRLPALLAEACVRAVEAIPRTGSGKVRHAALRAALAQPQVSPILF